MHRMKSTNILTWSFALLAGAMLIFFMNRGFDLSDEGFCLLKLQQINPGEKDIFTFQKLYRFLFGFAGVSILGTRIIRLALTVFSSLILAFSTRDYIRHQNGEGLGNIRGLIFPLILLGGFVSYGFGPQSISYNSLTGNLVVITLGLLTWHSLSVSRQKVSRFILPVAAGFLAFLVTMAKVPSGLMLAAVIIIYFLLMNERFIRRISFVAGFIAGAAIGAVIYSITVSNIVADARSFIDAKELLQTGGSNYSGSGLLITAGKTMVWSGAMFIAAFICTWVYRKWKDNADTVLSKEWIIYPVVIAACCFYYPVSYRNFLMFPVALLILCELMSAGSGLFQLEYLKRERNSILLCLFLFVAPFITTVGTAGSMFNSTLFTMAAWFSLMVMIMAGSRNLLFSRMVIIFTLAVTMVFITRNYLVKPYRIDSLVRQTENIKSINPGESIKVDSRTYRFLSEVKEKLDSCGFQPHDTVIGISKLSGLIYMMQGYSAGGAYWGGEANANLYNANLARMIQSKGLPQFVFIKTKDISLIKNDSSLITFIDGDLREYKQVCHPIKMVGFDDIVFIMKRLEE